MPVTTEIGMLDGQVIELKVLSMVGFKHVGHFAVDVTGRVRKLTTETWVGSLCVSSTANVTKEKEGAYKLHLEN